TRQRLARDGIAGQVERTVSGQQRADERCCSRTAKSCGPDAPTLASSLAEACRPNRVLRRPSTLSFRGDANGSAQSANPLGPSRNDGCVTTVAAFAAALQPTRPRHPLLRPLRASAKSPPPAPD